MGRKHRSGKTPVETTYNVPNCPATKLAHPLALLADSHNTNPTPILESLRAHSPALILIAGDFTYGSVPPRPSQLKMEESTAAMDLITGCAAIAPTYLSLGNHEWMLAEPDRRLISSTGAVVLDNTFISTVVDGQKIILAGLSSARVTDYQRWRDAHPSSELYPRETYHVEKTEPNLSWLSDFTAAPGYHVLLCHHPEYYHLLRDRGIDLICAGHAHGGQWRFYNPIKREWVGVWSPGQGFLPRLTSGVVENRLVVSRGLTNTTIVPRINNPTEIVYIT